MKLSKSSLQKLEGVYEPLRMLIKLSITNSPHDFGISSGFRTDEDQRRLYEKGRTRPGKKVTTLDGIIRKSYHQTGMAVDFFIVEKGRAIWDDTEKYKAVADHIKTMFEWMKEEGYFRNMELEWGGDWTFKDLPHIQIT